MANKHFVFILLSISFNVNGQSARIDSLLNELDNSEIFNISYVDLANDLSFEYLKSDPLKSPYYINLAVSVAKEINYQQGLIRATTNKGSSYWVNGLQDEALSYYLLSLSYDAENYPLEYVRLNNNIGEVFKKKQLFDSASKYYRNALQMVKRKLPQTSPSILSSNIGEVFLLQNELDSAEFYYSICLRNSLNENNQRGLAYAYYGLGEIAFHRFEISEAKSFQRRSLDLRVKIDDTRGIIQSYHKLGIYEIHSKNFALALDYWKIAEELAVSFRALDLLNDIYLTKSQHFYRLGEFKNAADYIRNYKTLSDSIKSEEFVSSLNRTKSALLSEISEAENQLLKQQQLQEKKENRISLILVISIGISLLTALVILRFYRKRKTAVAEFQKEGNINDSLLSLSKEVNIWQSDYDKFITEFLMTSKEVLNANRASYWYVDDELQNVACYRLIEHNDVSKSSYVFGEKTSPIFFKNLISQRTIAISDAKNDPRCIEIYNDYLEKNNVNSFLMARLFLNDKYIGFISYSMLNEDRDWSFSDQRYVGSLADILVTAFANNQNRLLEIEKESLIEKLIKKNKSLKEFNSVISHNLREPLTQVIGFTNILATENGTTALESKEIITRLGKSSARIDTVIKDLSTVLNEHDPVQKDLKNFLLVKVINDVMEVLSNDVKKANPIILKELNIKKIVSYKPFLFDIIYHLLSNALKFSNPQKSLEIKITSTENEENYYLEISDNGRGMDLKSFKDRIFKMYMRHHYDVDGRGIGLYIVKNRVESLNGKIEVKSSVMKGTTFTISLPKKGIS
jgi:signal transduction histidine kinase